jgi:hypothetical protein
VLHTNSCGPFSRSRSRYLVCTSVLTAADFAGFGTAQFHQAIELVLLCFYRHRMSKRSQEEALIATKTAIWNLGFDKNDAETSLAARPENVPRAMTLVMVYLNMWPDCKIMKD